MDDPCPATAEKRTHRQKSAGLNSHQHRCRPTSTSDPPLSPTGAVAGIEATANNHQVLRAA
jgi:hypothetical protein